MLSLETPGRSNSITNFSPSRHASMGIAAGLNLAGIAHVLALEDRVGALEAEVSRLRSS